MFTLQAERNHRKPSILAALAGAATLSLAPLASAEDEEWWDPTDWFNGDEVVDYDADWVGVSYDDSWDEPGSSEDERRRPNQSETDRPAMSNFGYDFNQDGRLDGYDFTASTSATLYTDGYYDGYFDGYRDDEFGYDDNKSLSDSSSFSNGYSDGYYDGFYDQKKGYQAEWTYYLFGDASADSDRNRARDESRKRGDRVRANKAGQHLASTGDRANDRSAEEFRAANRDTKRIRGTVESVEVAGYNRDGSVVTLTMDEGRTVTANLGAALDRDAIEEGDTVTLRGTMDRDGTREVLHVSRLSINGEQIWKRSAHPSMASSD